jgi:hypothetical protein
MLFRGYWWVRRLLDLLHFKLLEPSTVASMQAHVPGASSVESEFVSPQSDWGSKSETQS